MMEWFIETFRGRQADWIKARKYIAESANSSFKEIMQGYDAFVPYMDEVSEPSILIGTGKDSLGNEVPVRIATSEIHRNWLITGGTGSGKTSFVASVFARGLEHGYGIGLIDCKEGFFDSALRQVGAMAYRMQTAQRQQFIRSLAVINPFSDALVPLNVCKLLPDNTAEIQAYDVCLSLSRLFNA